MSMPEKQALPVVASCSASRMCPPEDRKRILDFFNELGDYNQQNIHLHVMIDSKDIRRVGAQGQHGLANKEKEQKRMFTMFTGCIHETTKGLG